MHVTNIIYIDNIEIYTGMTPSTVYIQSWDLTLKQSKGPKLVDE